MAGPARPDESPKDFSFLNSAEPDRAEPAGDEIAPPAPASALSEVLGESFVPLTPNEPSFTSVPEMHSPESLFTTMGQPVPVATDEKSTAVAEAECGHIEPTQTPSEQPSLESEPDAPEVAPGSASVPVSNPSAIATISSNRLSPALTGYALALTVLIIFCLMSGRLKLFGNAALESLPDIRPLDSNEFRKVPDGTPVPDGHVLNLGESRRFGDVLLTPIKVTKEPLTFHQFQSGAAEDSLTTQPVLKLWLRFENRSGSYAFPPFDAGLMSHRTPAFSADASTIANSWLNVVQDSQAEPVRVLNYLQTRDNPFVLSGQQSGKVLLPEEMMETFIACDEGIRDVTASPETKFTWRIQFRKGVHFSSGHGVTTLVEIQFQGSDITDVAPHSETLPAG